MKIMFYVVVVVNIYNMLVFVGIFFVNFADVSLNWDVVTPS